MIVSEETTATPGHTPEPAAPGSRLSARDRSRLATRGRLLESGRTLFAERGLHGVTTHDIAHHAEVAAGTFYLHFKDKRELFREVVQGTVDDLIERIAHACTGLEAMHELVHAQAEAMVQFAEANRALIRMLFSADTDAAAVESDVLNQLAGRLEQGRRERVAAGRAPTDIDPAVLGQAVVGMWSRVLAWWCEDPSRVTRDVLIQTLTAIELSGTRPASTDTARSP